METLNKSHQERDILELKKLAVDFVLDGLPKEKFMERSEHEKQLFCEFYDELSEEFNKGDMEDKQASIGMGSL